MARTVSTTIGLRLNSASNSFIAAVKHFNSMEMMIFGFLSITSWLHAILVQFMKRECVHWSWTIWAYFKTRPMIWLFCVCLTFLFSPNFKDAERHYVRSSFEITTSIVPQNQIPIVSSFSVVTDENIAVPFRLQGFVSSFTSQNA